MNLNQYNEPHLASTVLLTHGEALANELDEDLFFVMMVFCTAMLQRRQLSTDKIVTLSLAGLAVMTFTSKKGHSVDIELPPRTLQVRSLSSTLLVLGQPYLLHEGWNLSSF